MIFSLLFRYISTKLFNKLVTEAKYCTRSIGQKLRRRLDRIKVWAEKEGMELPAEDHLNMVIQVGWCIGRLKLWKTVPVYGGMSRPEVLPQDSIVQLYASTPATHTP